MRRGLGKDETGELRLEFRCRRQACELDFRDDGAGIVAERVREAAVRRGLLGEEQARALDQKGRSASSSGPGSRPATARTGMRDAASGSMSCGKRSAELGGKVAVSTTPGRFTRFRRPAGGTRGAR